MPQSHKGTLDGAATANALPTAEWIGDWDQSSEFTVGWPITIYIDGMLALSDFRLTMVDVQM